MLDARRVGWTCGGHGPDTVANDWCVGVYVCVIDDDDDDDDNDDDDDDDDDLLGQ